MTAPGPQEGQGERRTGEQRRKLFTRRGLLPSRRGMRSEDITALKTQQCAAPPEEPLCHHTKIVEGRVAYCTREAGHPEVTHSYSMSASEESQPREPIQYLLEYKNNSGHWWCCAGATLTSDELDEEKRRYARYEKRVTKLAAQPVDTESEGPSVEAELLHADKMGDGDSRESGRSARTASDKPTHLTGGPDRQSDDEALSDLEWLFDFDIDEDVEVTLQAEINGQLGRHARVKLGELRARLHAPASGTLGPVTEVFVCIECGFGVKADEDGCCTSCGMDTQRSVGRITITPVGALAGGPVDVVAAVRRNDEGRVWLCKRNSDGKHAGLAGMWEYPGGKVEPDEQLHDALVRELNEEFSVGDIKIGEVLDSIEARYGETVYRVTFFEVSMTEPDEHPTHTEVRWMTPAEACSVDHLPSGTIFNARHLAPTGGEEDAGESVEEAQAELPVAVREQLGHSSPAGSPALHGRRSLKFYPPEPTTSREEE